MSKFQKIESVGIVLLNAQNKVLVVFKKMTKVWEFPQGTREENEDLLETLKREVVEETNIKKFRLVKDFRKKTYYRFRRDKEIFDKTVTYFLGITDEEVKLSEEHEQYRWCSFEKANRLFKHENHKEVLKAVIRRLEQPLIFLD
ncbi:MAG: diadenosine tetraphosphate hydrolase [Candidatus Kerfeldbacteria bacterium CG08_land_8_20_14_0_20_40_16]|uniref:Diadenosine tetraphosphate hydrolase n=1 Tax=Candidatus Kerfeldbacteria bacterium CG08_land_8_20_14_0_20_40_16 TaxID=2014244 RepID=A0A2H0YX90_9BACT|nr:MAG: diadenosine tetraphosphate hydrolase [Candidatus Kerfeldbacteria bacterium CG08_land_8_20_14_0_20_40_16]